MALWKINRRPKLIRIEERTFLFAVRVIKMVNHLPRVPAVFVIGKQVISSATSANSNIVQAKAGMSKPDFIASELNTPRLSAEMKLVLAEGETPLCQLAEGRSKKIPRALARGRFIKHMKIARKETKIKNNFGLRTLDLRRQKGFTLIEVMVSVFIIGLLSAIALANYRGAGNQYRLNQASRKLVSDIRRAQNMALSGSGIYSGPYYGYGVFFDLGGGGSNSSYLIYGDKNGNKSYQPSDDIIETTITLPSRIIIQSIFPSSGNKLNIFYEPPDPTTYINTNSASGISASIVLSAEGTSSSKTINATTDGVIKSD